MTETNPSIVSVSGTGTASAPPDAMRIRLAASAFRPTLAAALADSESAAARVRAAFAAGGVAGKDAVTQGLSVHAEQVWTEGRGSEVTGYRSDHELLVTTRDMDAAGRVLGEALVAGGDDVRLHGVEFVVEDDAPLLVEARAAAWRDAVAKAEQIAGLAGRPLGRVVSVVEGGVGAMPPPMPKMRMMAAMAPPDMAVEPGGVDVHVSLAVQWELE
ncbi:MAG: SIMPL domain-containing protein [Actinobacteria bacterium]|nr:SIMPL domain-containing protein [Actinomycetota bacterium]